MTQPDANQFSWSIWTPYLFTPKVRSPFGIMKTLVLYECSTHYVTRLRIQYWRFLLCSVGSISLYSIPSWPMPFPAFQPPHHPAGSKLFLNTWSTFCLPNFGHIVLDLACPLGLPLPLPTAFWNLWKQQMHWRIISSQTTCQNRPPPFWSSTNCLASWIVPLPWCLMCSRPSPHLW